MSAAMMAGRALSGRAGQPGTAQRCAGDRQSEGSLAPTPAMPRVPAAHGSTPRAAASVPPACASTWSTPPPSRRRTTTPWRRRSRAPGLDVELVTSRFLYGPTPGPSGYRVDERFYGASARPRARGNAGADGGQAGRARAGDARLPPRRARRADVVHFQWLTVQPVDWALLPDGRPRVLTAHDVIPREPRPGQIAATRRLVQRMDAVVVHSEHGAGRLRERARACRASASA